MTLSNPSCRWTTVEGTMPVDGLLVEAFPEPGDRIKVAMEALQVAGCNPPETDADVRRIAEMPRPWDPATCHGRLREEIWLWLEKVAVWINEQHLWNLAQPGIPECWPAHPHLVHDLAVVACERYYCSFAVNPSALGEWHRYSLPMFLNRVSERLGDGCQPGKHIERPRTERDLRLNAARTRSRRSQRFSSDVDRDAGCERSPGLS